MRLVRCAAIVFAFIATPATAQVYPDSRPVPQTTDPATLTRLATGRAIKERLHLAFVAESHSDWSGARAQLQAVL
ncbi:MAG TPA: hypothetical protein VKG44_01495, partial [Candidatus Baltobacteraceae bacterium]|nr:hypothetical protein [Candidatus Baltobacteraceae bacterium]